MKGIIFTALIDMIELLYGRTMVDNVLDDCDLKSGGAYTSVGTYDYQELSEIFTVLSKHSNTTVDDLVHEYGYYLFYRFNKMMTKFFKEPRSSFDFLENVDNYISIEIKKLYPDAILPKFLTKRCNDHNMEVAYVPEGSFVELANGFIDGCVEFYEEDITYTWEDKNSNDEYGRIFFLKRK